jgi:uncharacterized protein YndB with AHSA1/START domain
MFGAEVASDWQEGSVITWTGEMNGKKYQDRGVVLQAVPERTLQYVHFGPAPSDPYQSASFHTVTITLDGNGDETAVLLSQNNNSNEAAREESQKNWETMLNGLKLYVEH